ncbi:hypothetical protein [Quatrionicoccus australiensis]|uniref:hypothetical protein n=1 Tax=Quatrionicoccus australiensis TaxID=138118 RepID=UPI001CFA7D49|nr:hypothetical protein [Quatrionicoccus australiensis]MCB4358466.1 hypothetical protein [Quatrionicoccus australiensis]
MSDKDYSLLRPFDLEAAKRGEAICRKDGQSMEFVAGPDSVDDIVYLTKGGGGEFGFRCVNNIRMEPLCWVEGKPVYKGDVLYHPLKGKCVIDIVLSITDHVAAIHDSGAFSVLHSPSADDLTWTPPKVKREGWVNVYPTSTGSFMARTSDAYESENNANDFAQPSRIACVRIEWEEQP